MARSGLPSFISTQRLTSSPRQLALLTLQAIQRGAFADAALEKTFHRAELPERDRRLMTELVYGSLRRARTLDWLIDQLATKPAHQQPPPLRLILHLGLYQLRYLSQIPASAAVNTTVELAKTHGFAGLTGFVNGVLRQYVRQAEAGVDPLVLPDDPVARLGVLYSYPDWIVQVWLAQFGLAETEALCEWMNRPPSIDLRINPLVASMAAVEAAFEQAGIAVARVSQLPQALRLQGHVGDIQQLPGYREGQWMVQDSSAQLVGHVVDPQPGEVVIDACAAPGGKTTHLAELMGDRGVVWACDRSASRLKKVTQNAQRLGLQSIQVCAGDSAQLTHFTQQGDRVLVDAPCSGLGTLHRHADARWRQTPDSVEALSQLQASLLANAATWVKPGGCLVYATCTLHPAENEAVVRSFLRQHSEWVLDPPTANPVVAPYRCTEGWLKIQPHHHDMDGFFIARLRMQTA